MKNKKFAKRRIVTILFAVLSFIAITLGYVKPVFPAYAEEEDPTYTYELTTVEVSQKADWIFTSNTPDTMLYKMVSVTVTYKDVAQDSAMTPYVLDLSGDGKAATGEKVTFSRDASARTVTATVTPIVGGENEYNPAQVSGTSAPYTLEDTSNAVVNGITATYNSSNPNTITTTTQLYESTLTDYVNVYEMYNDGSTNTSGTIGQFNLSGNLFPSEFKDGMTTDSIYSKEVTVEVGDGSNLKTAQVEITGIKFVVPNSIMILNGNFQQQVARSKELNMNGLNITFMYDGDMITVPATVFPSKYFKPKYFESQGGKEVVDDKGQPLLNITVKYVELTFTYPETLSGTSSAVGKFRNITVSRIPIHTPIFPADRYGTETLLNWNDGASIDITSWDFSTLHTDTGNPPNPQIALYKLSAGSSAEPVIDVTVDDGDNKKTVHFPQAGCRYRVDVTLSAANDFMWDSPYNGTQSSDYLVMSFEVQVDKGTPVIELSEITDVIYGTPNGDGTLSATIEGENMGKTWICESADNASKHINEKDAWYYHLEYYTSYTDESNNTPVPEKDLRKEDGKPKTAGTYYAVAVTHENSGYVSVRSEAISFEITQFKITTAVSNKTFARTEWTISDFLTCSSVLPYANDTYNETVYNILSIIGSNGAVDANTKFKSANEYTVTISILGNYLNNYTLSGDGKVTFKITTDTSSTFTFDVTGWVYGDTGADPQLTVSKSDPYYASNTGDNATDYTVNYYFYDSSKPGNKGDKVTETNFSKFVAGRYLVELIAKKDERYSDENPASAAGKEVDYVLYTVYKDFEVSHSRIKAPSLDELWVLSGGTEGQVYRYDDAKSGKEFTLTDWITDAKNTAADGSNIITVTISYTLWETAGSPVAVTFTDGKFTVNKAGHYTVTVTLNKNYAWANDVSFVPSANEYSYIGYVARQQLKVLTDEDITGTLNTYSGSAQEKSIDNWNGTALKISGVTVASLGGTHKPVEGGIITPDNSAAPYSNKFSVTNAGKYTVVVEIADKDNYEWIEAADDELRTLSLEYTLDRAALKVKWEKTGDSDEYPRFVFDGTQSEQRTPVAEANVDWSADNAKLNIKSYIIYEDEYQNAQAGNKVTKIGHYYIAVSDFDGDASANYVLPEPEDVGTIFQIYAFVFEAPQGLDGDAISGKTINETYSGTAYAVEAYIKNYEYYSIGGVYRIKVEILKEEQVVTEAKYVATYTVKITISDNNYVWKESVEGYEFTLEIERLTVVIEWDTEVHAVYNPYGIAAAEYEITNKVPEDDLSLELGYKQNGGDVALKDAGIYTVYAKSLQGEHAGNYKIVPVTSNDSAQYVVDKRSVTKPALPSGEDNNFNGASGSKTVAFVENYDNAGVTVVASGIVPNGWFTTAPSATVKIDDINLDFASGEAATFTYIRAGVYSFTVSLNAKNYFWFGDDSEKTNFDYDKDTYSYILSEQFTVNRKQLTAPNIKSQRAQEWDKTNVINFGTSVEGISYTVQFYCKDTGTGPSDTWLGFDTEGEDPTKGKQGIYYAELTLSVGNFLNYEWIANPNDKNENGSGYLDGNADIFYYTEDAVTIKIFYAITRGQLDISIFVKNYTFGDNGTAGLASFNDEDELTADSEHYTVYLTGEGASYAVGENAAKIKAGTLVFKDEHGNTVSGEKLFERGLPWNAGKYTLTARLEFGEGQTYEDIGVEYTFTVYARDITVAWDSLSLEYNAQNQLPTGSVNNKVERTAGNFVDVSGLEITVGFAGTGNEYKNVSTSYVARVTALNGDADALRNFKLPDSDITVSYEIYKKKVNVKGVDVAEHIFGDEIISDEKKFTHDGFIDGDGAVNAVVVSIRANEVSEEIGQYAAVGTYYVIVKWISDDVIHANNYDVTFDNMATFTVVQREITVKWDGENAHSTYGDDVDIFQYLVPTASNGRGNDPENAFAGMNSNLVVGFTVTKDEQVLGGVSAIRDAGTYTLAPNVISGDNWVIHFVGSDWQYIIYKATITDPANTVTPKELTYSAALQKVFDDNQLQVEVVNIENTHENTVSWFYGVVNSADATEKNVSAWLSMPNNNIEVLSAGKYYYVIKASADNHNDFYKTITVVVNKAKLEVQFDFAVMYGEDSPAAREVGFDEIRTAAVDGIGWTVTGFVNNAEKDLFYGGGSFYELKGNAHYTVVGYQKGDFTIARRDYTIAYTDGQTKLFTLECVNYEFELIEGTLTVNKIKLTVEGKSLSVKYNEEKSKLPAIGTEGEGYTVTHPDSTYGSGKYTTANANYKELIVVSSAAFTGKDNPTTASKGSYTLSISVNEQHKNFDYYDITPNDGGVEITIAKLTVYTIEGYTSQYDEQYHGLTVDGEPTVDPDNGTSLGTVFAVASDGTEIKVDFYAARATDANETIDEDLLAELSPLSGIPSYIDFSTHYIAYKISAGENYAAVYGFAAIVINQATNMVTTHFNFSNQKATKSSDLNAAQVAWTYGYMVEDGFNPEGDQHITDPVVSFTRANATNTKAKLEYELARYTSPTGGRTVISSGDYDSVTQLFEKMFAAGNFNAGYYRLTVSMTLNASTDNFTFDYVQYVFRVEKRALSITAKNATVVYGEDVTKPYVPVYEGLVVNTNLQGAKADTIQAALGEDNVPVFTTAYVKGNFVGGGSGEDENEGMYRIYVSNQVDYNGAVNYFVSYSDAWLEVLQREVALKIDDKENTYNLQDDEPLEVLTFRVADGSKYGVYTGELKGDGSHDDLNNSNQTLLTLKTEAIVDGNTNDVKFSGNTIVGYTIYAVYGENTQTNYIITFKGCSLKESNSEAIGHDGSDNNAGSYKIKQATFDVIQLGVFHKAGNKEVESIYYSGAENYYKAHLNDKNSTPIEFAYSKKDSKGVYQPITSAEIVEVGEYRAIGQSTNKNYSGGNISIDFKILKATLTLKANTATVQYGTQLSGNAVTDAAEGGVANKGRFTGFTYTASSEHLLDEIVEKYQANSQTGELVKYSWTDYSPSTNVGVTNAKIIPVCAGTDNITVTSVEATLFVAKRQVVITIVGWDTENSGDASKHNENAWCYYQGANTLLQSKLDSLLSENYSSFIYTDEAETFGASGVSYGALGVKLTLDSGAYNVGEYEMAYAIGDGLGTNFDVIFTNKTSGQKAILSVQKAKLTIYAGDVSGKTVQPYSRTYGDSIDLKAPRDSRFATDSFLRYTVEGMVDSEDFLNDILSNSKDQSLQINFTVKCGDKVYQPWKSTVSETYTVEIVAIDGGEFGNYIVDKYVSATLTISKRVISASTKDQTFGFEDNVYNNGLYGKKHEAVISFADSLGNSEVNGGYRPVGYTLTYDTQTLKSGSITYQTAGEAPTVVREGGYTVTVTLADSDNYVFAGGSYTTQLAFNVDKMSVSMQSLQWRVSPIATESIQGDNITNYISGYQAGYLTVVQFEFVPMGGDAIDITEGDADTPGTYYFDEGGMLRIIMQKKNAVGKYTVRIELKSTATDNIQLVSDSGTVGFVSASFDVTTKTVTMHVEFDDFKYGETPAAPRIYINNSDKPTTANISVSYALITDEDADRIGTLYSNSSENRGLTASEIDGLNTEKPSLSPNFVVGYYLLYAQYSSELTQTRYYVFKVDKKVIEVPEDLLKLIASSFTYNGGEQSVSIGYVATDMRPIYSGSGINMTVTDKGVVFTAVSAAKYTIGFALVDNANTEWTAKLSDGFKVEKDTLNYTWIIEKDSAENSAINSVITVPELSKITYGEVFDQTTVTTKDGYNGKITFYFMEKTDDMKPDISAEGWEEYDLKNERLSAKSYWIKVVVSDTTHSNYDDKAVICVLSIARKEITATVSGEITYGDDLKETTFKPLVDGLLDKDEITSSGYSYDFVEDYGKIDAGGEYYIILKTDDSEEVIGITAENYSIKAVRGLLVVNKRSVFVEITGKSSDYSVTPDVSAESVEYSVDNLATCDDKSALGIIFETDATARKEAGGEYWITIKSYNTTNYIISYQRAIYVINPLEVEVELVAQQNVFYGDADIWCANFDKNTIRIANAGADKDFVNEDLKLRLWFTGSSYAGESVNGDEKPTDAGVYVAKVTGASSNYRLIGLPEVEFTIQKRILDDGCLNIENQTYTGELLTPAVTVKDGKYAVTLFDATSNLPESINAGSYDVVVVLKDSNNYQWASTPGTSVSVKFTVDKANDEETVRLTIKGWKYGTYSAETNSPSAEVKSGGTIYYEYSTDGGKTYTSIVPDTGSVGTYYVRVVVAESGNYNAYTGEAVSFEITKYLLTVPVLTSEDITYTGSELIASISDFDSKYMAVTDESDARTFLGASSITAVAINAGTYNIYIAISDTLNYGWLDNKGDANGVLTLTWTVAKKKVALPTAGRNRFVVNGEDIVYIPDGFDASIMTIENNVYSYGGDFTAVVTLTDTSNYEWENGEEAIRLKWHITGEETVFAIILSSLILLTVAGAAGIAVQLLLNRRRKRTEASTMSDIESKDAEENTEDKGGNE